MNVIRFDHNGFSCTVLLKQLDAYAGMLKDIVADMLKREFRNIPLPDLARILLNLSTRIHAVTLIGPDGLGVYLMKDVNDNI